MTLSASRIPGSNRGASVAASVASAVAASVCLPVSSAESTAGISMISALPPYCSVIAFALTLPGLALPAALMTHERSMMPLHCIEWSMVNCVPVSSDSSLTLASLAPGLGRFCSTHAFNVSASPAYCTSDTSMAERSLPASALAFCSSLGASPPLKVLRIRVLVREPNSSEVNSSSIFAASK